MLDHADRLGIVVIDETAAVGLNLGVGGGIFGGGARVTFSDETVDAATQAVHRQAIEELIARDKNHPSVVLWSLANEPESHTAGVDGPTSRRCSTSAREADPTRPVGFVNMMLAPPDACLVTELADVVMVNRYYGWYLAGGDLVEAEQRLEAELRALGREARQADPRHRVRRRRHAPGSTPLRPVLWTEEYQADLLDTYHRVFDRIDAVVGEHVWNFADFATGQSFVRVDGNKKGVFTRDRRPKARGPPPAPALAADTRVTPPVGCRRSTLARAGRRRCPATTGAAPPSIVHLGVGAFARAHLAVYADDLLRAGWPAMVRGRLAAEPDAPRSSSARRTACSPCSSASPGATATDAGDRLAHVGGHRPGRRHRGHRPPDTTLVTLTVTEKGYEPDGPTCPRSLAAGLGPPAGAVRPRRSSPRSTTWSTTVRCCASGCSRPPTRSTPASAGGSPTDVRVPELGRRPHGAGDHRRRPRRGRRAPRRRRPGRGRRRAPPLVGDRARRDGLPPLADVGRRGRGRRGAVPAPQAVAAERPALGARLRRSARRLHDDRRGGVAPRRLAVRPAAGRRRARGGRPPGVHAASDVRRGGAPALRQPRRWATRARRSAPTARRSCGSGCCPVVARRRELGLAHRSVRPRGRDLGGRGRRGPDARGAVAAARPDPAAALSGRRRPRRVRLGRRSSRSRPRSSTRSVRLTREGPAVLEEAA